MSDIASLKLKWIETELKQCCEKYEKAYAQKLQTLNEAEKITLNATLEQLEREIARLEEQRRQLVSDDPPRVRGAAERALEQDAPQIINDSRKPSPGDIWREPVTGMEFVYIPAGQFMMGSPESEEWRYKNEGPMHEVRFSEGFWIGKYPVTNAQYRCFKAEHDSGAYGEYSLNGNAQPVFMVSWNDAIAFTKWMTKNTGGEEIFRLPTEAEWEYACRAGTTTPFYFGKTISTDQANFDDENDTYVNDKGIVYQKQMQATNVGSFPPNTFGLYDMHGNVSEWCQDTYASYNETPKDGSAYGSLDDNKEKIMRGASWNSQIDFVRSASRVGIKPEHQADYIGFRVVVVR